MKPYEIETWALRVIDVVKAGNRVEDARVELKREWIPADKAARHMAGHANAAQGDWLLWLIGVDEEKGVVGVDAEEFADWWAGVQAASWPPYLQATPCNVYVGNYVVVAILIETDRLPYLVKNPDYGSKGVSIEAEVPWREMNRTRTAKHADLIRLLGPRSKLPEVELVEGTLFAQGKLDSAHGTWRPLTAGDEFASWQLLLDLYFIPSTPDSIVFPGHRCEIILGDEREPEYLVLHHWRSKFSGTGFVAIARPDILVEKPKRYELKASHDQESLPLSSSRSIGVTARLPLARSDRTLVIRCDFEKAGDWTFSVPERNGWTAEFTQAVARRQ